MNKESYIEEAEKYVLHTYNRYPLVIDHGKGVYLYDTDGKEYLDFAAGIAVQAFGYGDAEYAAALKEQIDKVLHTSNLYYHVPAVNAARRLSAASGMERVFFTNSGTEAVEGAVKAAKKYAYTRDGRAGHEIIAMNHSFHGRSIGALSVTGNAHYREPFEPLMPGVRFADFNELDSVKALINEKTCAIILETVQGEGGIYPAGQEFLEGVRRLCDAHDILLILDEIQCGMGRTGHMFAWQRYGIKPDVMTVAKALGCGVPVGAFLMTEKVGAHSLVAGDHGSTYGGNPLACAAVSRVIDLFEKQKVLENVKETGACLGENLKRLVEEFDCVKEHRGVGLLQGLVFDRPVGDIITRAMDRGLVLINAGTDIIRFVPPLVITKAHVDEMMRILRESIRAAVYGEEQI